MDIEEAKRMGYKTVYFTFDCIGDTILLMSALGYLYQKHNQKFLVGTHYKEIIENCHYIDVLDEFYEDNFGLENYYKLLINDINPIFISATSFRIEDQKIKPIWGRKHILVNICSKIGFEGYIEIAPRIFLNDEEKSYGRFFEASQIAIISTGNQPYKSMPTNVAQTIVDNLKHRYNFVQVGSASDPLLIGALDKRGDGGIRRTAAILHNSDLFVGGIGGLMHMARAVGCRSVIAYTTAEPKYLVDYACNINVFAPTPRCEMCGSNYYFPYLIKCQKGYTCIKGICSNDIENAIEIQMKKRNCPMENEEAYVEPEPVFGVEDYVKRFGKIRGLNDVGFNNNTDI